MERISFDFDDIRSTPFWPQILVGGAQRGPGGAQRGSFWLFWRLMLALLAAHSGSPGGSWGSFWQCRGLIWALLAAPGSSFGLPRSSFIVVGFAALLGCVGVVFFARLLMPAGKPRKPCFLKTVYQFFMFCETPGLRTSTQHGSPNR